jgi:hypothetical protein
LAFLGDFGKFFGLGSSEQVLGDVGSAVGGFIGQGPKGALIGQQIGKGIGRATSNLAGDGISPLSTADQALEQSAVPVSQRGQEGPQEQSTIGTTGMVNQAGFGFVAPALQGLRALAPQASRFLSSPGGSLAIGTGTGVGVSLLTDPRSGKMKPVLTQSRRNKAKVRQMVNFLGIEGAANFLSQASGQSVTGADVVSLLLRTFRNDGAFITKAQVRNLRRTTNRFKSLEKQVKEATSMSRTTRRASPVRRASSTTLIKN